MHAKGIPIPVINPMKPYRIPLLMLAMILAASCTYMDSGIYEVEPIAGDSTLITVTTSLDTFDQVILTDSVLISWEATVEKGELYYVEAILSSEIQVYELTTDYDRDTVPDPFVIRDSFWMDLTVPLASDIYYLEMTWYYSTNSNSLADYYRLEAWTLSKGFEINLGGIGL